jgi:hypothetical protein
VPPNHHKEIARFLAENTEGNPSVHEYRDNEGNRPIPVGCFGGSLFSTIGGCDTSHNIPSGCFEFAAFGKSDWLPNAVVSSIYWLKGRAFSHWPLVCEDAVKQNTKSKYRHMAFIPSSSSLAISTGQKVQWLLGVPITDSEIGANLETIKQKAKEIYPRWLFNESA